MSLTVGTRLGPYEIVGLIGRGGMGEVYRARDARLSRDVAIKILPEAFAHDPDRVARFQREAQVLASLNHPHIAGIHGLEESDGVQALVLELVEGPTLADRIARGPVAIDEALAIATQIADALAAAHEKGVVHRDLKPANIKVASDDNVKVLDFGLAKIREPDPGGPGLSNSPTMMASMPGVILGTAAYMPPEQAKGKDTDRTADVWAFGCVLYEMLTGHVVFGGDTLTEILSEVIKSEPDWGRLPNGTPSSIRRLLRRCLQKDRRLRLHDMADARIEIHEAEDEPHTDGPVGVGPQSSTSAPSDRRGWSASATLSGVPARSTLDRPARRERLLWVGAIIVATAIAATAGGWYLRPASVNAPEIRLQINTPPGNAAYFAISPDGRSVVFQATTGGTRLWLRPLDAENARPLDGTGGAIYPFWSPDSRSVGFFADQKLKRIDIAGGAARTLAEAPTGFNGATWNSQGLILFVPGNSAGLFRVSSDGGNPVAVTRLQTPRELAHRIPHFLPDGRHFVYWVSGTPDVNGVHVGDLESGSTRRLTEADMLAGVAPPDYLLYVRQETLLAQRLDLRTLELTGDPLVVSERVEHDASIEMRAAVSASAAGPLGYRTPSAERRQVMWVDRVGTQTAVGEFDTGVVGTGLRMSPDGRTVGFMRRVSGQGDVWLMETARGVLRRFTSDRANDGVPVWSPDGTRVAFESLRRGVRDLYLRPISGVGAEQVLLESPDNKNLHDWSPDGRFILYSNLSPTTARDLWVLPVDGDRQPSVVVQTRYEEVSGRFSPDGRWISYQSNETGRNEIYVRPFPEPGAITRISTEGGAGAQWRPDGREIFYQGSNRRLMAVPIVLPTSGRILEAGTPVALLTMPAGGYAVAPDGKRFFVNTALGDEATPPITILLNWNGARRAR